MMLGKSRGRLILTFLSRKYSRTKFNSFCLIALDRFHQPELKLAQFFYGDIFNHSIFKSGNFEFNFIRVTSPLNLKLILITVRLQSLTFKILLMLKNCAG